MRRQPALDRVGDDGAGFDDGFLAIGFGRVGGGGGWAGEPFVVGARVAEEGEDAGARGGGDWGVDEDEVEVGAEGGAEEARLRGEDGGGGAGAVEAEDAGARGGHFGLGVVRG